MINTFITFPTREEIENLKVGDLAPDYAGRPAPVTEIFGRGVDVDGRAFVCYYTASPTGNGSSSNAMTEDTVLRGTHVTCHYTSAEIDTIELRLRAEREREQSINRVNDYREAKGKLAKVTSALVDRGFDVNSKLVRAVCDIADSGSAELIHTALKAFAEAAR